jgi:hypothetical protein
VSWIFRAMVGPLGFESLAALQSLRLQIRGGYDQLEKHTLVEWLSRQFGKPRKGGWLESGSRLGPILEFVPVND